MVLVQFTRFCLSPLLRYSPIREKEKRRFLDIADYSLAEVNTQNLYKGCDCRSSFMATGLVSLLC